jgi:hypothetical protein
MAYLELTNKPEELVGAEVLLWSVFKWKWCWLAGNEV